MNQQIGVALLFGLSVIAGMSVTQAQTDEPIPLWAYAWSTQPQPGDTARPQIPPSRDLRPGDDPVEIHEMRTVEGSSASYSRMDIRDSSNVIDWFPGDHPPMTDLMKHGPASLIGVPGVRGCASCHLPNGKGRPENAPPAGQPIEYTIQQLKDMRDGLRYSADPRKPNSPTMNWLAAAMTDEEMQEAAEYFAEIPWTRWMYVVEADLIPEMHLEEGNMYVNAGTEAMEPLAGRIVESPVDEHQANYIRDPRSPWNVYVPVGSLAKGEELVANGAGKTIQCGICHGSDLMGLGAIPGIAGRSPSYMMRQLYDMKKGTRNGTGVALMKPVIANLNVEDMTNIVAYLASIVPPPAPTNMQ